MTDTSLEDLYTGQFGPAVLSFIQDRVAPVAYRKLESLLCPLRDKSEVHFQHYLHSLRVAMYMHGVVTEVRLDPKVGLFAGALHDIGKVQTPVSTLGKTSGWTDADTKIMWSHVMDSYRMIRDCFDFSADIILWHHRFQKDGYPKRVPPPLHDYSLGTKVMIPFYGRLLAICDQWDAFHRPNDRNKGNIDYKQMMLDHNPDQKVLLTQLFERDILHEHYYAEDNVQV